MQRKDSAGSAQRLFPRLFNRRDDSGRRRGRPAATLRLEQLEPRRMLARASYEGATDPAEVSTPDVFQRAAEIAEAGIGIIAVGSSDYPGDAGAVTIFDAEGNLLDTLHPYGQGFEGGVRVAVGDINGDGTPDVVTAAGPTGAPGVQVFAGQLNANGTMQFHKIGSFFAFDPNFDGGVYVATGDINGDGRDDIIAGMGEGSQFFPSADAGPPLIKIIDGTRIDQKMPGGMIKSKALIGGIAAFGGSASETGVRVGAADVNGDGRLDVLAAEGPGGSARVWAYDGEKLNKTLLKKNAGSGGDGAFVAGGDVNGDGFADVIVGQGAEGGEVRVFSGADGKRLARLTPFTGELAADGVRVGSHDANGDGIADVLAGTGRGLGAGFAGSGNTVRTFDLSQGGVQEVLDFKPFPAGHGTGVFVAGNGGLTPLSGGIPADDGGEGEGEGEGQGEEEQPPQIEQKHAMVLAPSPPAAQAVRSERERDRVADEVFAQEEFWRGVF